MTDFEHVPYSLGFKVEGGDDTVTIRGKRKWYAPWLRYPDRTFSASWMLKASSEAANAEMRKALEHRIYG